MSARIEVLRIAQVLAAELVVAARDATAPSDVALAQRAVSAALELVESIGFDDRRAIDAVTRLLTLATVLRLAATIDEASADTVIKRAVLVYDQLSPGTAGMVAELVASH
ncbi:MAG: hypothetical protein NZ518_01945, partial [Dehalococcoidia bacterium]|nr:hypothetical protein [Dehalococcoidia bacterium]